MTGFTVRCGLWIRSEPGVARRKRVTNPLQDSILPYKT